MITNYDKELINKIILPFNIKPFLKEHKDTKSFWGYKLEDGPYYSFFFSLHKKEVLLLTFRFDQSNISKIRVYVNYDNVETIRHIINAILNSEILDSSIYEEYIYKERELTDEENHKLKSKDKKRELKTKEALECHWKLPGITIIPDPSGINISNLNISYRLMNALYRYDILTVKQFMELDPVAMKNMKLLGNRSYEEALILKNKLISDPNYLFNNNKRDINYIYTQKEKIELDNYFFKINEYDYIKNEQEEEDLIEYRLKGEKIIKKAIDIIKTSDLNYREKDIYIKYNNIDDTSKSVTLEQLGDYYGITRERVRQILKRSQRKLRRYKYELIPLFNEIIGEKQYSYLIEGILNQKDYKLMKAILLIILNDIEFNKIKPILDNCVMLNNGVNLGELSFLEEETIKCGRENAGSLWTLKEEQQLIEEFIMGISIEDISQIHKRTPEAIRKRLIRLNLITIKDVPRFYN